MRDTLGKVTEGEVDAGLVYVSDAQAAGGRRPRRAGARVRPGPQLRRDRGAGRRREHRRRAGVGRPGHLRRGPAGAAEQGSCRQREQPVDGAADHRVGDRPAAVAAAGAGVRSGSRSWCCRWPGCWCAPRGRRCPSGSPSPASREALRLSPADRDRQRRWSAWCSASRWPGCWPARRSRAGALLRALVTVPLVLPPVVGGVALLTALRPHAASPAGGSTTRSGSACRSPRRAWWWPQSFVAMPFLVLAVEGALRSADARFEEAAATLGASRWQTFRRVTLPLVGARRGRRARCSPGRGRWASSAPPSPSPATIPGTHPAPCRSPSTWRCEHRPRGGDRCSAWCCSSSASPSWPLLRDRWMTGAVA